MLTLTEFLADRFDEAEQMVSLGMDSAEFMGRRIVDGREFVRADFAAKRRIVATHDHGNEPRPGYFPTSLCADEPREFDPTGTWMEDRPYCDTLRLLALPYADHPDYDAEWRP